MRNRQTYLNWIANIEFILLILRRKGENFENYAQKKSYMAFSENQERICKKKQNEKFHSVH